MTHAKNCQIHDVYTDGFLKDDRDTVDASIDCYNKAKHSLKMKCNIHANSEVKKYRLCDGHFQEFKIARHVVDPELNPKPDTSISNLGTQLIIVNNVGGCDWRIILRENRI